MNLYLIGYRGSGKSTVAPLLANLLGWTWLDSDGQVELLAGCSVAQIFAENGEACFRKWETNVIEALSRKSNLVVATGGGAPMALQNRRLMAASGRQIWLKAAPKFLWARILSDETSQRPALTDKSGLAEIQQVLAERTSIYEACADYAIDVESLSPEQIAQQIAEWWVSVDN